LLVTIGRRVLSTFAIAPIALFLVFSLLRITGNPIEAALGDKLSEAEIARRVALAGLDRPLLVQFSEYVKRVVSGDFGAQILHHLSATLEVTAVGVILLALAVLFWGALAAWHSNRLPDSIITGVSIMSFALPGFLGAVLTRELARIALPEFQISGRLSLTNQIKWVSIPDSTGLVVIDAIKIGDFGMLGDALLHLMLPAIALSLTAGTLIRVFRNSLESQNQSPAHAAARNRGIPFLRVFWRHAIPPALPTVLAGFGVTIGAYITGVVFVERVFEIRGLGYLLVEAILERDFLLVQGIFTITFLIVILLNTATDIVITVLDKRQRAVLL
jgi:peptide/nickel transport system permease protein